MINIANLIPTHNRIRDPKSIRLIVDFLKEGRIFRCQDKPICLTRFLDDDKLYIRDGHRRLCAAFLAGADLLDCEYKIEEMSYKDYMTANPGKGWYTPFDPRVECRLPDFFSYKNRMINSWIYYRDGFDIFHEINNSHKEYLEPRTINSLKELVKASFPNGCN